MNEVHKLLDKLSCKYTDKNHYSENSLLPSVAREEILLGCQWFPSEVPESIIDLYTWRGGQPSIAEEEEFPFWFRDMGFLSLKLAESGYKLMMEQYGEYSSEHYNIELKHYFPFAEYNQSWYVIPSSSNTHRWSSRHSQPVIFIHHGINMYYTSVENMLLSCIGWVSHPTWDAEELVTDDASDKEIWRKYNNEVFSMDEE